MRLISSTDWRFASILALRPNELSFRATTLCARLRRIRNNETPLAARAWIFDFVSPGNGPLEDSRSRIISALSSRISLTISFGLTILIDLPNFARDNLAEKQDEAKCEQSGSARFHRCRVARSYVRLTSRPCPPTSDACAFDMPIHKAPSNIETTLPSDPSTKRQCRVGEG